MSNANRGGFGYSDHSLRSSIESMDSTFAYYRPLARALSYVEHQPLDSIKLGDVASATGISASRLSHLFREKLGMSFSEWLTRRRISKAMELIELRDLSTTELAHASGFGSYRSFERSFKKLTGTTPSEYKKCLQAQMLADLREKLARTRPFASSVIPPRTVV